MEAEASRPQVEAHPFGGGLRSCMFRCSIEYMHSKVVGDHPIKEELDNLLRWNVADLEKVIFRAQPAHPNAKEKYPWVWGFMLREDVDSSFKSSLHKLKSHPRAIEGVKVTDQHSVDGGYTKFLASWASAQRERANTVA